MKIGVLFVAFALAAAPSGAFARGGHHSGGSHYGGHSHGGSVYGFRTGHCKSANCYRKHPGGTYVHPLTSRKHR